MNRIMYTESLQLIIKNINFPEGPAFAPDGSLWFVEQDSGNLIKYSHGLTERFRVGGRPNGIAFDQSGLVWYCDSENNEIRTFQESDQTIHTITSKFENNTLNMPNDLAFSKDGSLLFTCPGPRLDLSTGYICCYDRNKGLCLVSNGMSYPNGLAFSPDFKKLFVAETSTKRIWVGDWNESSSSWLNVEEFCYTGGSVGPDGIAIAENGFLYAAIYGSSQVKIFDQNGSLSGSILVPGKNPTNCAFDPFGKLGLVITESQQGNIFSYATNLTGTLHKL